jgi:hypothetical protein
MSAAVRASQDFRDAEMKCQTAQTQLTDEANSIRVVEEAIASLERRYKFPTFSSIVSNHLSSKCSVDTIPILHKPELIMSGWGDEEIEDESSCM